MYRPLVAAIVAGLASCSAVAAEGPDYSLTVYSAAQPGQLSTATLANYGANLPGYALVRDAQPAVGGNQEMSFVFSAGNDGAEPALTVSPRASLSRAPAPPAGANGKCGSTARASYHR